MQGAAQLVRLALLGSGRGRSISWSRCFTTGNRDEPDEQGTWTVVQTRKGLVKTFRVEGSPASGYALTKHIVAQEAALAAKELGADVNETLWGGITRRVRSFLKSTFLPAGYPQTVGPGYLSYVGWQLLTNFAVTANSVLASTFMLYSVGLGAGAIPTAGALNWVLKDGLGQMGTLIFGKTIAHSFDVHSKSWYFLSMVKLKVATGLEILTILLPGHFLVMGSLANSLKGLAWMANGSTRSVFNLSFALDNNIADITAKGTSQYICASMFGTVAGASLCTWVGQDTHAALACYSALTVVTLAGAYTTVKTIPLATLNSTRLQLLCESYLNAISDAAAERYARQHARLTSTRTAATATTSGPACAISVSPDGSLDTDTAGDTGSSSSSAADGATGTSNPAEGAMGGAAEFERAYDEYLDPQVPSPVELAAEDPPLPWLLGDARVLNPALIVGGLERVLDGSHPELLVVLLTTFRLSKALVVPRGPTALHVVLHEEAAPRDILQAYLQACLLRRRLKAGEGLGATIAIAEQGVRARQRAGRGLLQGWPAPKPPIVPPAHYGVDAPPAPGAPVTSSSSSKEGKQDFVVGLSSAASQPDSAGAGTSSSAASSSTSSIGSSIPAGTGASSTSTSSSSSEGSGTRQASSTVAGPSVPAAGSRSAATSSSTTNSGRGGGGAKYALAPEPALWRCASHEGRDARSSGSSSSKSGVSRSSASSGSSSSSAHKTPPPPPAPGDPGYARRDPDDHSRAMAELRIVLQDTLQTAERLSSPFMRSLEEAGWRVERIVVEADRR
eukprot:CAMPEP_0202863288 /NCGR_PEP_ID=MMETSP1391-20130828/3979_1 /ASSEMBLY_ACC=CAM_ASM_000867 /TAXON_ID=1034604 /ORGANISM="Chlamydomonas leiostraca, Strain SAG 11-49" /LENGTH=789 /DNA_ID=CAMNT_0049542905 /DNA_START=6 /DNA_END=2372 /DNA_ORIENTATION=-